MFQAIAQAHNTTQEEVREAIQAAIDEAWNTTDLTVMKLRRKMFPNGKPTPEEFILTLAAHEKKNRPE